MGSSTGSAGNAAAGMAESVVGMTAAMRMLDKMTPGTSETPAAGVHCPACGEALPGDAKFCSNCGQKIERQHRAFCTKCGAKLDPNDKFCSSCGTPAPAQQ